MSQHSDEVVTSTDSFWEPGNYKRTTKRIEDGNRLCNDLIQLVTERAEMEKNYAKGLKTWAKKWNDIIEKGPEYGTTEAAWKGVTMEAERVCEVHLRVKERLLVDVVQEVKRWQKDNFQRNMMQQLKQKKEMDDAFKKAQKQWAKMLEKVERAKADYHAACKQERSAQNQQRNAGADSSLSPDQMKKLGDRVEKCREDVARCRDKYDQALKEIGENNDRYKADMSDVFQRCQDMEARRLTFFREMLLGVHACLNLTDDSELPQIYDEFRHTVANADHSKDLKYWANNHGDGMPTMWPQFEDYIENPTATNKKKVPAASAPSIKKNTGNSQAVEAKMNSANRQAPTPGKPLSEHENVNGGSNGTSSPTKESRSSNQASPANGGNPFGEADEWEEEDSEVLPEVDDGRPGVPVRALYDYKKTEDDELSLTRGDLFEKLEDEDEQGWCKGRKNGRIGLYPANYAEPI
ncbi:protein kinase C and casein kinase substrate in neurons protein 1-like isoform X2 [Varroa jacobsoni]|uniref:Protein kinase C and casein kinase substrate in neurons protein 1 n=1 Tax=Varroa destructor TaxID=109461 RepID=A0A7M7K8Z7_VARDE|nr:protein kinase C and casein kinase substrate in neurons protein 1-like isoform X3 [Varroa destructor]XP_022707328.1 protein kinase C and casein kinase substrate in neurons protein 1-like isoform X2 [Varroa jacobsoni]